jgi:opacity protein-like surface antigen
MKSFFFIVSFSLFTIAAAHAQTYGIKGGVNFANLSGSDADGADAITGLHLGVIAEFSIFQNLSLQPELLYSAQGANINDVDYKLGYLTLPVMAKFYLNDKLSVHAGPQFGLLISENDEIKEADNNKTDFGISGGIEYNLLGGLFVQGRYNSGMSNLSDNVEVKNSVIQLSIGYMF